MRVCTQCRQLVPAGAAHCPHDGGRVEDVDPLPEGVRVGGYRIVRLLGEGGMGYVYEAVHEVLGRRTAMKFLRPEFSTEPEVVARFMQEAQAVNLINHEHIVNVYDIGDGADGSVYFVMEYLAGKDLSDLQSHRALPLPLLVHIYSQVLRGLLAAHTKQIVHRDLKPANVFITRRDENPYFVKLLDVGIAKLRDGSARAVTREGAVMGTPSYMSPEQISGKAVDHRSDIFTLGVMLYRAATGVAPFHGESFGDLAGQILGKEPPSIREAAPAASLPISLERLVQKAMRKRIEERYQSVAEMLLDLETVRREAGLAEEALARAIAEHAGMPIAEITASRPSVPSTRASLGESLPAYQGVPDVAAAAAAAAAATPAATPPGARSRAWLWIAAGAALAIAAIVVVVTQSGGRTGPAAPPPTTGSNGSTTAVVIDAETPAGFVALRASGDLAALRAGAEARLAAGLDGDAASQGQVVAALALAG